MKGKVTRGGVAVFGMLVGGVGCEGKGQTEPRSGREMPMPKLPPAYPPSKDVAIDEQLRAQADQELVKGLRNGDPNVRAHAIEATAQVAGAAHGNEIVGLLTDRDP